MQESCPSGRLRSPNDGVDGVLRSCRPETVFGLDGDGYLRGQNRWKFRCSSDADGPRNP